MKQFSSEFTPVPTLLVLKSVIINHLFPGLLHLQRLHSPARVSFTHVDDAYAHPLDVKTLMAASGLPTGKLTKAKGHAYFSPVLNNNFVHLPLSLCLFICITAPQGWAARKRPAHQTASSTRMPASSPTNLLTLPPQPEKGTSFVSAPEGRAIGFLLWEEKSFLQLTSG